MASGGETEGAGDQRREVRSDNAVFQVTLGEKDTEAGWWDELRHKKRIDYVATQESFGGRILTFDVCSNALGEFATLDYQPTKLAVSDDGQRLFVSVRPLFVL